MNRQFNLSYYCAPLVVLLLTAALAAPSAQSETGRTYDLEFDSAMVRSTPLPVPVSVPLQSQQATFGKASTPHITPNTKAPSVSATKLTFLQYLSSLTYPGWVAVQPATISAFKPGLGFSAFIGDDLLREYQCQIEAQRALQRGQRKIIINVYQFATADGAYGAYCAGHRGSSSYLKQGDASSEDQDSISFCKDHYFICLYSTESDDNEAKTTINKLTEGLIENIKVNETMQNVAPNQNVSSANQQEGIFNLLPIMERVRSSDKLVMGPISMKRFFPAPYSANLTPLLKGAVADYKLEWPDRDRLKLLIAYYPSNQAAGLAFTSYTSTLRSTNKEKSAEGFVFPTALFKVVDTFILCQLRDKQIIVINGARHKDSLSQLAHEICF